MQKTSREEVRRIVEFIINTDNHIFLGSGTSKRAVLKDQKLMRDITNCYQRATSCVDNEMWCMEEAIESVLPVHFPNHK